MFKGSEIVMREGSGGNGTPDVNGGTFNIVHCRKLILGYSAIYEVLFDKQPQVLHTLRL